MKCILDYPCLCSIVSWIDIIRFQILVTLLRHVCVFLSFILEKTLQLYLLFCFKVSRKLIIVTGDKDRTDDKTEAIEL